MAFLNLELDVLDNPTEKPNTVSILEVKLAVILRDYLQPDSRSELELVADSILGLLPSKAGYRDEFPLAYLCTEIAQQIPYHHPAQAKLVILLRYLARSPKFLTETKLRVGFYLEML
jgi:hypothetical protein